MHFFGEKKPQIETKIEKESSDFKCFYAIFVTLASLKS